MKIPFIDFVFQYKEIRKVAEVSLQHLMKKGDFILGHDVQQFEEAFAQYIGARYAVGVNSGTDALFLGLLSLGINPGDEVLVPAFTYIASAYAISYAGAKPVFVDIDRRTYTIDPSKAKQAITAKTKAIMPVHLYGQSADMRPILDLAAAHGLKIIEDAAQAHGTEFQGKNVGALGDMGAFSFYPTKNLGAFGDGGMITTNHADLFEKARKWRDYGKKSRYEHASLGYNSRLDSIQAVFLNHKLKHLDAWNKKRVFVAQTYKRLLGDVKDIGLPYEADYGKHVYHIFAIRIKNRDRILKGLNKAGIGALVHYPLPLHLQEVYASLGYQKGDFPVAEKVCQEILSLPIYPHMTKTHIEFVVKTLKRLVLHG